MITMLIKGDINAAFKAADEHKVEITSISMRTPMKEPECLASTIDECLPKIMKWFNGDVTAPFPAGTLLYYFKDAI